MSKWGCEGGIQNKQKILSDFKNEMDESCELLN